MKETLPTLDMTKSDRDVKGAKTIMSGQPDTPQTSPTAPLTPPPLPPSPPPVRPIVPRSAPAGGAHRTLVMAEPRPPIPLAWLGVVSGPGAERGRTYTLLPETVIGRTAGDVLLSGDPTVSGRHAKVRLEPKEGGVEGEQIFVLYDLASANGTNAGTHKDYSDENSRVYRYELNNGDYVLLGETVLTFWRA